MQRSLAQWASIKQAAPSAHSPHSGLPQSVSGSVPLGTPSLQLGGWQQAATSGAQAMLAHTRLWHSAFAAHSWPDSQRVPQMPPQSAPVSF